MLEIGPSTCVQAASLRSTSALATLPASSSLLKVVVTCRYCAIPSSSASPPGKCPMLHYLGHWVETLKNYLRLQDGCECYFIVADEPDLVDNILVEGGKVADAEAQQTLALAREAMGLPYDLN